MKKTMRSGGRRILSAMLCLLMAVTVLPSSSAAWTGEEGEHCTSLVGEAFTGYDGEHYYAPKESKVLYYDKDGSFHVQEETSDGYARTKYLFVDDSGGRHWVYCAETSVLYGSGNSYVSENSDNSAYFRN